MSILYDSASEYSFISLNIAKHLDYKIVVPNISIKINGFNESKTYKTNIIEFVLDLGIRQATVQAAVVPELKPKLKFNNAETIVDAFGFNNIVLADKYLSDKTGIIDMVLGINNMHHLPIHTGTIGTKFNKFLFFSSCVGIMIAGDEANIINNLDCLPIINKFQEELSIFCTKVPTLAKMVPHNQNRRVNSTSCTNNNNLTETSQDM